MAAAASASGGGGGGGGGVPGAPSAKRLRHDMGSDIAAALAQQVKAYMADDALVATLYCVVIPRPPVGVAMDEFTAVFEAQAEFLRPVGAPRGVVEAWAASHGCRPHMGPSWVCRTRGALDAMVRRAYYWPIDDAVQNFIDIEYLLVLRRRPVAGRRGLRDRREVATSHSQLNQAILDNHSIAPSLMEMTTAEQIAATAFPASQGHLVFPIRGADSVERVVKACGDMVQSFVGEVEPTARE